MNDGIIFEAKVERWLIKRGARFTERRARQRGKVAARGHECDVHATMSNDLWRVAAFAAVISGVLCILAGLSGQDAAIIITFGVLGLTSLGLVVVFLNDPRHIWVEVKSGEGVVTREVVWKLTQQVDDVRRLTSAPWYPSAIWLVAHSHFDRDALAFARQHRVRCFVEHGSDIREVI